MSQQYIEERVQRYNTATTQQQRDDLLYRIGSAADIFDSDDLPDGVITPEHRCYVLNWIYQSCSIDLRDDIPLLLQIFTDDDLKPMVERVAEHFPDFHLMIGIREGEEELMLSFHLQPQPGCQQVDPSLDFPWQPFWDSAELYWCNLPGDTQNCFDFALCVYPDQSVVLEPKTEMEQWELELSDEDAADLIDLTERFASVAA